jgi:hypothetical protein
MQHQIIGLNLGKQPAGELPELLVVVLIAHRLKKLNRYLSATEMIMQVNDKRFGHLDPRHDFHKKGGPCVKMAAFSAQWY